MARRPAAVTDDTSAEPPSAHAADRIRDRRSRDRWRLRREDAAAAERGKASAAARTCISDRSSAFARTPMRRSPALRRSCILATSIAESARPGTRVLLRRSTAVVGDSPRGPLSSIGPRRSLRAAGRRSLGGSSGPFIIATWRSMSLNTGTSARSNTFRTRSIWWI